MDTTKCCESPITANANTALDKYRFLKYVSFSSTTLIKKVGYCGAGDAPIGLTSRAVAIDEDVAITLLSGGTVFISINGAITALQKVYTAADGYGSATPVGPARAIALDTLSSSGIIECLPITNADSLMEVGGEELTERAYYFEQFEKKPYLTAELDDLTDSSGGTASDATMAAVAGGGAALEADVKNNFATTAKKLNTLLFANQNFELAGTNMTTALGTYSASYGGIILTTAGANNDQAILQARSLANQSRWGTGFSTALSPRYHLNFQLSSVAAVKGGWGLSLTNAIDLTTDADQIKVWFDSSVSANLQVAYSIAGTDTLVDTGIVAAADTKYHVLIDIDSSRIARVYIATGTGALTLVATTTALTSATLKTFEAIQALTAAAKAQRIHNLAVSYKLAA